MDDLITAAELAQRLGVSPGWVYEHKDDLGVVRLGKGPRPRLRFDVERALAAMTATPANDCLPPRGSSHRDADLLPIKGRDF